MRALFLENLQQQDSYEITGESLHHLVNVIRIQKGEDLLLLNGTGMGVETRVLDITKRSLRLGFLRSRSAGQRHMLDLALGVPKKEALETCLKSATELGFRRIFLVRSQYSQIKVPDEERLLKLLISALEQANSFYLPELVSCKWEELPWNDYRSILLMSSQEDSAPAKWEDTTKLPRLLVVGPEGGFSPEENTYLSSQKFVESLRLPTPILRTTTAVAAGAGVLLQRLLDQ